jgi:hypothetical protein
MGSGEHPFQEVLIGAFRTKGTGKKNNLGSIAS